MAGSVEMGVNRWEDRSAGAGETSRGIRNQVAAAPATRLATIAAATGTRRRFAGGDAETACEADVVSGRVLAVASEARSCLLIAFFTEAPAAASESARVVAERLGLMTRVIERVQRFGIDDRVRVPRL